MNKTTFLLAIIALQPAFMPAAWWPFGSSTQEPQPATITQPDIHPLITYARQAMEIKMKLTHCKKAHLTQEDDEFIHNFSQIDFEKNIIYTIETLSLDDKVIFAKQLLTICFIDNFISKICCMDQNPRILSKELIIKLLKMMPETPKKAEIAQRFTMQNIVLAKRKTEQQS